MTILLGRLTDTGFDYSGSRRFFTIRWVTRCAHLSGVKRRAAESMLIWLSSQT
jgi:hypothetical protein